MRCLVIVMCLAIVMCLIIVMCLVIVLFAVNHSFVLVPLTVLPVWLLTVPVIAEIV